MSVQDGNQEEQAAVAVQLPAPAASSSPTNNNLSDFEARALNRRVRKAETKKAEIQRRVSGIQLFSTQLTKMLFCKNILFYYYTFAQTVYVNSLILKLLLLVLFLKFTHQNFTTLG